MLLLMLLLLLLLAPVPRMQFCKDLDNGAENNVVLTPKLAPEFSDRLSRRQVVSCDQDALCLVEALLWNPWENVGRAPPERFRRRLRIDHILPLARSRRTCSDALHGFIHGWVTIMHVMP